ncbi:MAG TPA: rhodanese-like domain-containing protein [Actinomycetes bacterium]|jgi:rhodanese-related sulfurtransferase|nr:rhodanese-like domain-containing protein [Actinomycetes bacterium]
MFPPSVPSVRPSEVAEDAFLLDVREPDEWAAGHAAGALHVPIGEVIARLPEIPTEQPVVCVCRVGARSAQVTAYLVQQGYDAVNLDGGMAAWEADGRPMVSETGQPATVL